MKRDRMCVYMFPCLHEYDSVCILLHCMLLSLFPSLSKEITLRGRDSFLSNERTSDFGIYHSLPPSFFPSSFPPSRSFFPSFSSLSSSPCPSLSPLLLSLSHFLPRSLSLSSNPLVSMHSLPCTPFPLFSRSFPRLSLPFFSPSIPIFLSHFTYPVVPRIFQSGVWSHAPSVG